MTINIAGIDRVELFMALHNRATPLGLGFLHALPGDMTREQGEVLLARYGKPGADVSLDYVLGRPIKVSFIGDELRFEAGFDRDHGEGACAEVVKELRLKFPIKEKE